MKGLLQMNNWHLFEEYVKTLMAQEKIPGVAVAVSENGNVIYEQGFGLSNLETNEKITPDTIFGIASITKSFTALAIMKLVENGQIQLNDSVNKYLPAFQLKDYDMIEDIQIHHLLSHTSGIPTITRKEEIESFTDHLKYLSELTLKPIGAPGEYICYNNDLFLLLGAIIEKVTGENYKEFIRKEIFIPQNMERTTFQLDELKQFDNVTTPYIIEGNERLECAWPTLGNYAVGGGIRSTVKDLLKYGSIYVDKENNFASKMAIPVHEIHGLSSYGYALQVTPNYTGVTLVEHGGSQPGVSSNFGFIPEKGLVIAVLTNITNVSADKIWLAAANAMLRIPINGKKYIEPHDYMKENELSKFVGTYTTGEGEKVDIRFVIGQLQATVDGKNYMLRASNKKTLVMTPIEKPMRFFFDENEETWALLLGLRMFIKEGEVR